MPTIHIPKYPIVDPEPSVSKAVSNFNAEDWFHVALFTSAGFITGWFGASKQLRGYNSKFLCGMGFTAGMLYGIQSSVQRFIGLFPNEREVALYGVCSQERLDRYKKLSENPNIELIDSDITK